MKKLKDLTGFIFVFLVVMATLCMASFAADLQYTENVIPEMTSNTTPSGKASASSTWDDNYHFAWKAFNHVTSLDDDAWATQAYTQEGWLEYDFIDAKCISKYTLVSRKGEYYSCDEMPKDWTFEGWDEELNKWIVLDTRQNITDWQEGVKKDFTFTNKNQYNNYRINITANVRANYSTVIGEMEMMEAIKTKTDAPTNLKATAENKKVSLSWTKVDDAMTYNIKRSTTEQGEYSTIGTTSENTYTDNAVTNGTTYYYVVSAVNEVGESENSNEVSATPINPAITLKVTAMDKAKTGDEITADIVIHNALNICAEDLKIAYDTSKLELICAENVDGMKIYKEDDVNTGIKRYILACLGKTNAANGDKVLMKLKFKAISAGEAKIDITNGRIADNSTLEMDVAQEKCGEKTILIEGAKDVNLTGDYTLLDLGIDAWYYGSAVAETDTTKYYADQIVNGTIDDDDLSEIVAQILNNSDYPANK